MICLVHFKTAKQGSKALDQIFSNYHGHTAINQPGTFLKIHSFGIILNEYKQGWYNTC